MSHMPRGDIISAAMSGCDGKTRLCWISGARSLYYNDPLDGRPGWRHSRRSGTLGNAVRRRTSMPTIILAEGPPPLTQQAADAALDTIDFIAAAVRGYDAIEVTNIVRPIWRAHLAYWYQFLPPVTRQWYANAPQLLMAVNAQWPQLNPWQRAAAVQQWSMELPQMLWMLDPVLAEAQAVEMQQAPAQPAWSGTEAAAVDELNRRAQMTARLQDYSTQMTNSTIGLMRAFNRNG